MSLTTKLDKADVWADWAERLAGWMGSKLPGTIEAGDLVAMRGHLVRMCRKNPDLLPILEAIRGNDRLQDTLAAILFHAFGPIKAKGGGARTAGFHATTEPAPDPAAPTEYNDKPHQEFLLLLAQAADVPGDLEIMGDDGMLVKIGRFLRDNGETIISTAIFARDFATERILRSRDAAVARRRNRRRNLITWFVDTFFRQSDSRRPENDTRGNYNNPRGRGEED